MERRFAAILAADVMGYSRHTERSEEASTATLRVYRAVVEQAIAAHKGHIFSSAGDGLVAEFPSIVEAVRCAVEIQNEIATRNTSVPDNERMQFRIGVNLGDVIISDDNNLYGTGVNVAVRLEQLAQPGGICISQTVYNQVRKIVEIPFEDIGERRLKNIADPVRVYRILPAPLPWYKKLWPRAGVYLRSSTVAALILLLIFGVAAGVSYYQGEPAVLWDTLLSEAPKATAIAVVPFDDKGDSPALQTFSSGLTNDIMAGLSRTLSVFEYQGKPEDARNIGRELKARYVLEGSVAPSGGDLFYIRPKLKDAQTGRTVWQKRFDRNMAGRSDVDDEIACQIVAKIAGGYGVIEMIEAKSAARPNADQLVWQAREKTQFEWTAELFADARKLLRQALELDPTSRPAKRELAWHDLMSVVMAFPDPDADPNAPPASLEKAAKDAKEVALEIINRDSDDGRARMLAATAYFFIPELDLFVNEAEQAIKDAPCDPQVLAILGALLGNHGNWPRGVMLVERAHALNPRAAQGWYQSTMYLSYYFQEDYERALDMIKHSPDFQSDVTYALFDYISICGQLGHKKDAEEAWRKILEQDPGATAATFQEWYGMWNFPEGDIAKLMEGVRKSGVLGEAKAPPVAKDHITEVGAER